MYGPSRGGTLHLPFRDVYAGYGTRRNVCLYASSETRSSQNVGFVPYSLCLHLLVSAMLIFPYLIMSLVVMDKLSSMKLLSKVLWLVPVPFSMPLPFVTLPLVPSLTFCTSLCLCPIENLCAIGEVIFQIRHDVALLLCDAFLGKVTIFFPQYFPFWNALNA